MKSFAVPAGITPEQMLQAMGVDVGPPPEQAKRSRQRSGQAKDDESSTTDAAESLTAEN